MTPLYCIILLEFTATFALGQLGHQSGSPRLPVKPEAVVRSLYREVVARHPFGIPGGADRKAFAPYLSKDLIRRLDTALACEDDYYRQHKNPNEKPKVVWLEDGLFSGADEEASPASFHVESTQPEKDGYFRLHLRLTYREPAETFNWYVDVIVAREKGRFVVDDVIYLKDENNPQDMEMRLSHLLTIGCDGSRWVGHGEDRSDSKQ